MPLVGNSRNPVTEEWKSFEATTNRWLGGHPDGILGSEHSNRADREGKENRVGGSAGGENSSPDGVEWVGREFAGRHEWYG